jgi:hypothetical protein
MGQIPNMSCLRSVLHSLLCVAAFAIILFGHARQASAAQVTLEREFLSGVLEKLPPFPFEKEGRYRGVAKDFRFEGIDAARRELRIVCRLDGEYDPKAALASLAKTRNADPKPHADKRGWKDFQFDVRVAINIEPSPAGLPLFRVRVDEVKRREFEGLAGVLAKIMGRFFDELVTKVASKKVDSLNERINAQILKKIAMFRDYGVFCSIDYYSSHIALRFDVTRMRSEGIVGYIYPLQQPGTVPLYRWVQPRLGGHFYTTNPLEPADRNSFRAQGITGYVFAQPVPGSVPVYRWHSRRDWYYTVSSDASWARGTGYRMDGVGCHILAMQQPGTIPLYRFVDPRNGLHFYTTHEHAEFMK